MNLPSAYDYLPEYAAQLMKLAEEKPKKKSTIAPALKAVGQGALGLGVGTGAGYLGMKGLERAGLAGPGTLPYLIPAAGAGLGLTYGLWKAHEREALRRAIEGE